MITVPWWRTSFGEEEVRKLAEAVSQEHISQGPVTELFEQQIAESLGVPYAVATTSGSTALLLALLALGIGRDDEVIVPNRTWIASAHAVMLAGAKVVLVDVCPDTPSMDPSQIKQKITSRTKAIMPVHLAGRSVDMEAVRTIAEEYGLMVIEDACQALFSKNASGYLGTQSNAGCFSLAVTKLISTGQGGIVVTKSEETYQQLSLLRTHGVPSIFTDTWDQFGFNFKFTDLLASFGLVQLSQAPARIAHVNELYAKYASAIHEFPFLKLIPVNVERDEIPLYVEVLCSDREQLVEFLESHGVQSRSLPPDLHESPYLDNWGEFPNSRKFAEQGLMLPSGPTQPLENIDRVLEALTLYRKQSAARSP